MNECARVRVRARTWVGKNPRGASPLKNDLGGKKVEDEFI